MGTTSPGPSLEPCPHCGQTHGEEHLVCPDTGEVLDLEGRLLDGKFRLVRKIGSGGMSTVWKAENVFVRKFVAIKLMHPEFARNARTLARFRNEATAAGRIGSEHICDILDFGQSDLGPYIVMEMLIGQDLGDFVHSRGLLDPELAVLVVRQALIGLSAAHRAGIIHRDLKPENVFLHEPAPGRLVVKLMDFGISKFTEEVGDGKTGAGVLMGTPEYMSPEQTEGAAEVDLRTDLWAMGAILYYALTGREAFTGRTLAAVLLAVTTKPHRPLNEVRGDLSPGLSRIVDKCLDKDPAGRYGSAIELSDALAPFEKGVDLQGAATVFGIAAAARAAELDNPNPTQSDMRTVQTVAPSSSVTGPGPEREAPIATQSEVPVADPAPAAPPASGGGPVTRSDELGRPATMGPTGGFTSVGREGGQTWSNELDAEGGKSADGSWSMGGGGFDDRPERAGGGGGSWFSILLVVLAALGVGGYFYMHRNDEPVDPAPAGDSDASASATAEGESTGAEPAAETGPPDAGSEASGEASGSDAESTGDSGSATTTEDGGGESESSTGGGGSGGAATSGGGTSGGGSGDGGSATGGDEPPKPVRPDMSKLYKVGNLYTTKAAQPTMNYAKAVKQCSKLRSRKTGRLKRWRLAKPSEISKFRNSGVKRVKYWGRASGGGSTAPAVNLSFDKTTEEDRSSSKPRPFCVSTR